MSGLPDVPAARVIEAIESLLFRAEEECSWVLTRTARRLLGTLLPEEPDPITSKMEPLISSPSLAKAVREAMTKVPKEEPPPRPPKSPRQSPKPRGQTTGSPPSGQRGAIVGAVLEALRPSPRSVADLAEATGIDRKRTGITLARLCSEGRAIRTSPGMYVSA